MAEGELKAGLVVEEENEDEDKEDREDNDGGRRSCLVARHEGARQLMVDMAVPRDVMHRPHMAKAVRPAGAAPPSRRRYPHARALPGCASLMSGLWGMVCDVRSSG